MHHASHVVRTHIEHGPQARPRNGSLVGDILQTRLLKKSFANDVISLRGGVELRHCLLVMLESTIDRSIAWDLVY